jgi:hypothetical protein
MAVRQLASLPGEVASLFGGAMRLIDEIREQGILDPFWTFGGGTVLMLRYGHRKSRDVDIFVPDAQYLGYVNPRKSSVAESVTDNYIETAGSVKLVLADGEIDFVAAPNLTEHPFELWEIAGAPVRVETAAEIIAKKMWHRGNNATARDLFDLAAVAEMAPEQIGIAAPFFQRHAAAFLEQIDRRRNVLEEQFNAINIIGFHRSYLECVVIASGILQDHATPQAKSSPARL